MTITDGARLARARVLRETATAIEAVGPDVDRDAFADAIEAALVAGMTAQHLARRCGFVAASTVTRWADGRNCPKPVLRGRFLQQAALLCRRVADEHVGRIAAEPEAIAA